MRGDPYFINLNEISPGPIYRIYPSHCRVRRCTRRLTRKSFAPRAVTKRLGSIFAAIAGYPEQKSEADQTNRDPAGGARPLSELSGHSGHGCKHQGNCRKGRPERGRTPYRKAGSGQSHGNQHTNSDTCPAGDY